MRGPLWHSPASLCWGLRRTHTQPCPAWAPQLKSPFDASSSDHTDPPPSVVTLSTWVTAAHSLGQWLLRAHVVDPYFAFPKDLSRKWGLTRGAETCGADPVQRDGTFYKLCFLFLFSYKDENACVLTSVWMIISAEEAALFCPLCERRKPISSFMSLGICVVLKKTSAIKTQKIRRSLTLLLKLVSLQIFFSLFLFSLSLSLPFLSSFLFPFLSFPPLSVKANDHFYSSFQELL